MLKCWGVDIVGPAQVSPRRNAVLLHFDLRTWPWRVGCRSIAPEPQLVRSRLTAVAAATRPKAAQDAAVCVLVCVCVGVINNATVITFVRGESISLEFMVNFQGMTQREQNFIHVHG